MGRRGWRRGPRQVIGGGATGHVQPAVNSEWRRARGGSKPTAGIVLPRDQAGRRPAAGGAEDISLGEFNQMAAPCAHPTWRRWRVPTAGGGRVVGRRLQAVPLVRPGASSSAALRRALGRLAWHTALQTRAADGRESVRLQAHLLHTVICNQSVHRN
ncbi:unnamed protein product [Urochloa humidicola]